MCTIIIIKWIIYTSDNVFILFLYINYSYLSLFIRDCLTMTVIIYISLLLFHLPSTHYNIISFIIMYSLFMLIHILSPAISYVKRFLLIVFLFFVFLREAEN